MTAATLLALAAQVEHMGDITCPLCGETGFDIPGFVFSHLSALKSNCEVEAACVSDLSRDNAEVAASLRARAGMMG